MDPTANNPPTFGYMYISGQYNVVYTFPNYNVAMNWQGDTETIKQMIAGINDNLEQTGRTGQGTLADYQPWLLAVRNYKNHWGRDFVAPDIQAACHDVEAGLGLPLTRF